MEARDAPPVPRSGAESSSTPDAIARTGRGAGRRDHPRLPGRGDPAGGPAQGLRLLPGRSGPGHRPPAGDRLPRPQLVPPRSTTQTGAKAIRFLKDLDQPVKDKNVIVVQDMIDSGLTLHYINRSLSLRRPRSLEACILFDRPQLRLGGPRRHATGASRCPTTSSWATASTTTSCTATCRTWPI